MSFKLSLLEQKEYNWTKNSDFYVLLNNTEQKREENFDNIKNTIEKYVGNTGEDFDNLENNTEKNKKNTTEEKQESNLYGIICSENTDDINLFLNVGKFWMVKYYPFTFFTLIHRIKTKKYLD